MMTNQVQGPGSDWVANYSNLLMFGCLTITAVLAFIMIHRGSDWKQVFAVASLTGTLDLIVFNKVGSPQFMLWLLAPAVAGLIFQMKNWRVVIYSVLGIEFLTQLAYPVNYLGLLGLETTSVVMLTMRNAILVGLLIWANVQLSSKKFFNEGSDLVVFDKKPVMTKIRFDNK